jgi:hypothetical protein
LNSIEFIDPITQQQRIMPDLERRMKALLAHGQYSTELLQNSIVTPWIAPENTYVYAQ